MESALYGVYALVFVSEIERVRFLIRQPAMKYSIERFYSSGQLYKFIGTKESAYIRKEFSPHRICLEHQHGGRFIILEHQNERRDVM